MIPNSPYDYIRIFMKYLSEMRVSENIQVAACDVITRTRFDVCFISQGNSIFFSVSGFMGAKSWGRSVGNRKKKLKLKKKMLNLFFIEFG